MRLLLLITCCSISLSCSISKEKTIRSYGSVLNAILNKHNVKGTILIYNSDNKTYNSNSFHKANTGYLPAGTFSIPHTLIALESNAMESKTNNNDTIKQSFKLIENITLEKAYESTFTPYYQELTRRVGLSKMLHYLDKFHYPKMMINEYTLDSFWFYGTSKITPFEQINFLENLNNNKISIKKKNTQKLLKLMLIKETNTYKIYGKESCTDYINNSWFIGFIVKNNKIYYFATNLEPNKPVDPRKSYVSSQEITLEALSILNIL